MTTSHLLGFTVCGMNLKDPTTGKPRDGGKVKKSQAPKDRDECELYLEKLFRYKGSIDLKGIKVVKEELEKMLQYF